MGRMFLFGNPVLWEGFKHSVYTLQMSSLISFLAYLLTFCDTTLPLSVCVTSAIVFAFLNFYFNSIVYYVICYIYAMLYAACTSVTCTLEDQSINQSITTGLFTQNNSPFILHQCSVTGSQPISYSFIIIVLLQTVHVFIAIIHSVVVF